MTAARTEQEKSNDSTRINLAVIANDITYIKEDVILIKRKLEGEYITKTEFDPIKKIVYGMVGILLSAAAYSIVRLIFIE